MPAPRTQAVGRFWVYAMGERCFQGWHRAAVLPWAVAGVAIFTVGFPAGLLAVLVWERARARAEQRAGLGRNGQLDRAQAIRGGGARATARAGVRGGRQPFLYRRGSSFEFLREAYHPRAW